MAAVFLFCASFVSSSARVSFSHLVAFCSSPLPIINCARGLSAFWRGSSAG